MSDESVLITGASGYIGSLLSRELLREGRRVIGLDSRPPRDGGAAARPARTILADITRPETLSSEIQTTAILIHCAALVHRRSADLSRSNYFRVNCTGTRNILRAVDTDHLRRIVFLSTVSVYGIPKPGPAADEGTKPSPEDPYGESKLAAEAAVREFSQATGVPATIFRLAPVYGRDFLLNIEKRVYLPGRAAFFRIGCGRQRLSLCAVGNVAAAVRQCLERSIGLNEIFNLKDPEDYSINDVIAALRNFHGHFRRPVVRVPRALPSALFRGLARLKPDQGARLGGQLRKISGDAVYSGEKLVRAGIDLPGSLSSELPAKPACGGDL